MSAAHYKLNNLMAIVDRNKVQIDGLTENVMSLEPLVNKWESYGWHVVEVDGHDIDSLVSVFSERHEQKPIVIIAYTLMEKALQK